MTMETMQDRKSTLFWVGLGVTTGLATGWWFWRRRRAQKSSPLRHTGAAGTALVTGASSGIGAAYARRLAQDGYAVILVARREARLQALAAELTQLYKVNVDIIVADLSQLDDLARVEASIAATDDLTMLVNNAGFGLLGDFAEKGIEPQEDMIRVHVLATVRLTRAALGGMLAHGRGAIVNVSSVMAFYPMSGNVTYSATKSYLNAFTEALQQELRGTGVRIQALCPGFTRTEFQDKAHIPSIAVPAFWWMTPEAVVEQSLRDLNVGKVVSVPGVLYRALVLASRMVQRAILYDFGRWVQRARMPTPSPAAFTAYPRRKYDSWGEFLADMRFMYARRATIRTAMHTLSPAFRERLMLAVTHINECRYCAHYHSKAALVDGLAAEEIAELLEGVVDNCPADEMPAVLYAQHWAETEGAPEPDARQKLTDTYTEAEVTAIDLILRMIKIGNYAGNTLAYIRYCLPGGK